MPPSSCVASLPMPIAATADTLAVDLIEELRLRRWARENYCYAEARQASWHPLILDEMRRIDDDLLADEADDVLAEDDVDSAPDGSTILCDDAIEIGSEDRLPVKDVAAAIGPIVPLAPDLAGLHGPHEINPPHTRIVAPAGKAEMHYT
jgi:hypothetical protein